VHCRDKKLDPSVDPIVVARDTPGFSGADLASLANEAAIFAVRGNREVLTARRWPAPAPPQHARGNRRTLGQLEPTQLLVGGEGCVEGSGWGFNLGEASDEGQRVWSANGAVHTGVFPFDTDGSFVLDCVEHAEDRFPWDVSVAGGYEVPAASGICPRQVGGQAPVAPVELFDAFLAVDVVDTVAEVP
jgi:SpoVK/Ycf46/Vps4 family AAA+-type ATPase